MDDPVVHTVLLSAHVCAGAAGLVLGPLAVLAPKRRGRHPRFGTAYQVAVAVLTTSALGLVARAPASLWWLGLVAAATQVAAAAGWVVARHRRPGWLPWHVRLTAGSYVSLATAALVVNWASPLAWVLPTLLGTPVIAVAARRAGRPRPVLGAPAEGTA